MSEYRIQQATARREEGEAALLRPDGSRYYSDEEHKERRHAIRREFEAEMDSVAAEIEGRFERARGELEALEHADPAAGLSTGELQRAVAMKAFVGDEVADLSLADLARRCRAVAASSPDKGAMYALAHLAARRAEEDLTGELADAVAELRHALDPNAQAKLAAAREALEEVQGLKDKAYLARRGAKDAADLYLGDAYSAPGGYWTNAS